MIFKNMNNEDILLTIRSIVPEIKMNQYVEQLLTGEWFIQTIGESREVLMAEGLCRYSVVKELQGYFVSKEELTIEYLSENKTVIIKEQPNASLEFGGPDPMYSVNLELAVIPNV